MAEILPRLSRQAAASLEWILRAWTETQDIHREYGISRAALLGEQVWLFARYGIRPDAYCEYRLYEPGLTRDEKVRYLSEGRGVNRRRWSLLAPARYHTLYNNKLLFNHFFGAAGLPVAVVHGVFDRVVGHTPDGRRLRTPAELRDRLRQVGAAGFVFKPVHGARGDRVLVFAGPAPDSPDAWLTLAGERYDAERLAALTLEGAALATDNPGVDTESFLIEERLRPHPVLAELLGPTLCTVRVQTIVNRAGAPEIIAAVFRLQAGAAGVDHLVHGGVGCWVDLDSGVLSRGRVRTHRYDVTLIPGSDRSFLGVQLPDWPAVRDVALRAAAAFPWVRAVGWDIGLSDRGPMLIEGNVRWSPSLIQLPAPRGLMTGEFKALCDELRAGGARGRAANGASAAHPSRPPASVELPS